MQEVDGASASDEQLVIEQSFLLHVVVEYGINCSQRKLMDRRRPYA